LYKYQSKLIIKTNKSEMSSFKEIKSFANGVSTIQSNISKEFNAFQCSQFILLSKPHK
jgi:hypothetical protein